MTATSRSIHARGWVPSYPVDAEILLYSVANVAINPTGHGFAGRKQIQYGGAQQLTDACSMSADGTVTFHEAGTYFLSFYFQFTRETVSHTANLVLWSLIDDTTAGIPVISKAMNANVLTPTELTLPIYFNAGQTLKGVIMRDTSGANDGGLGIYTIDDTTGGAQGPNNGASASLIVYRLKTQEQN